MLRYSREQVIGYKSFERLSRESHVTVKYNPDDPDFSALSGINVDRIGRVYAGLVGLLLLLLLIVLGCLAYGFILAFQD